MYIIYYINILTFYLKISILRFVNMGINKKLRYLFDIFMIY
jgi:hypothetical protein